MRTFLLTIAVFLMAAAPALALQAGDTMDAWSKASQADRAGLMKRLFGQGVGEAEGANIRRCLDDASSLTGHAALPIKDVAAACASSKDRGDPV